MRLFSEFEISFVVINLLICSPTLLANRAKFWSLSETGPSWTRYTNGLFWTVIVSSSCSPRLFFFLWSNNVFSSDQFSHASVGQQHEFLNELVCLFALFQIHAKWFSFFVQLKFHFHFSKAIAPFGIFHYEVFGPVCWGLEFLLSVVLTGFDHILCIFVSKTFVAMNDSFSKPGINNTSSVIHFEYSSKAKLVLVWS